MVEIPHRLPAYRPLADYGIIGNLTSTALVAVDGSIDWCCLPRLDSPSVFAALLDAEQGGHFQIRPAGDPPSGERFQHYIEATNVLVTGFETDEGRVEVCDFMPTGPTLDCNVEAELRPELHRIIRCTHGRVTLQIAWAPRLDYARADTTLGQTRHGFVASGNDATLGLAGLDEAYIADTETGPVVTARIQLERGDRRVLSTRWDDNDPRVDPDQVVELSDETVRAWHDWLDDEHTGLHRPWAGEWEASVQRSELVLKLMAQRDSGALAAAPTTSLPETIGGVRNWDYRFTWIRDAAQIAQAFFALGHRDEADQFILWAEHVACDAEEYAHEGLQIMYPLRQDVGLEERILDHLEGYHASGPVRIGNAAADQLQLDVYGELLNAVYERVRLSEQFDTDMAQFLSHLVEEAGTAWHHPDFGIWELQNGPFQLVYSKMMTWVALHRACWLAERDLLEGDTDHWRELMGQIRRQILEYGWRDDPGAFVMRFVDDSGQLDAANLLMPMMEFLPADDPRVQATINQCLERLTVNDLVFRYHGHDGLSGQEGAFALCTCWMVDALALSDRIDEATRIYENLLSHTNHLGLLAEQIDPFCGELLGNFPQAYSHLGIINSALYLAAKLGRDVPVDKLLGLGETSSAA